MDIMERKLLIEQVRKELMETLKQYEVGLCIHGEMIAKKNSGDWDGFIFVIPEDKYEELVGAENG